MTSLTYSAHMFVFVFLNAMDLSKEGCHDHLDADEWKDNLTDTVFLEMTKDPKDRVNCTLETECRGGREAACHLLRHCFNITNVMTKSPKCEWESSKEIPYYHFICLIVNAVELPSKACEYDTVCEIHSEKASTYFDSTTTQTTTTAAAVATLEPTTTLPETTSTTTTTLLPSSIATLEPTTTATLPVLPSPITSAIATLEPKTTTTTTLAEGQGNTKRIGDEHSEPLKDTTADSLKYWLALSLLLNAIFPPAVYLFMRHRWRRDRLHWTLTRVSSGGVTGDQPKTESDAPPASANQDAPTELLLQTNTHSEDTIHTQL